MGETIKQYRESIKAIAKGAFQSHRLTPSQTEGPVRMWLCHKTGTGMYHFRVIAAPGFLAVYGDVGDGMVLMHDNDPIPWLRGAIHSPEYLLEKMIKKHTKFFRSEAEKILQDMVDSAGSPQELTDGITRAANVEDNWNKEIDTEEEFEKALWTCGEDTELAECAVDYSEDDWWTVECLKKFIELLDAEA
jgi:hypothetical protein